MTVKNTTGSLAGSRGHPGDTSNRAALFGVLEAVREATSQGFNSLVICCANTYALNCPGKWMKTWQMNNWKSKRGKTVRNRDVLWKLSAAIDAFGEQNIFYEHVWDWSDHGFQRAKALADWNPSAAAKKYV
ncbi:ribonuclease H-like [Paramacrobiotus metropolitanus]|uniref:ribonuclease H-like n=1 Tax=Paramacrobiotus metropolitanus TaxID=2943436 RepID=UPI0024462A1F|nr:ribonuclease H-like [Paramacrobiotus metropolitanus]XP_055339912.1 ribonuclease H-like [Paramacrobiotus metropolitanus]